MNNLFFYKNFQKTLRKNQPGRFLNLLQILPLMKSGQSVNNNSEKGVFRIKKPTLSGYSVKKAEGEYYHE